MGHRLDNGSCMNREVHVQFCEQRLGKFQALTHLAVKLAFGFNTDSQIYTSIDEIMKSKVVNLITNNKDIDQISINNKSIIRLKQASDFESILKCNKELIDYNFVLKNKSEEAFKIYKAAQLKIKNDYDCLIQEHETEYEQKLIGLQNEYSHYFDGDL